MISPEPIGECEAMQRLLFELRDNSADPATMESLRVHLAVCPNCRAAQSWDARFQEVLHSEVLPEPSPRLAAAIGTRLRARRRRRNAGLIGIAASLLIASGLVAWLTEPERPVLVNVKKPLSPLVADDIAVLPLFQPPPVDSFDVLARQQNGYVAALRMMGKE